MDVLQENVGKVASMAVANGHRVEPIHFMNGLNGKIKEQEANELTENNQDETQEILSYPKKQSRGPNSIIVESSVPFKRYVLKILKCINGEKNWFYLLFY